jgi:hypothetical protein
MVKTFSTRDLVEYGGKVKTFNGFSSAGCHWGYAYGETGESAMTEEFAYITSMDADGTVAAWLNPNFPGLAFNPTDTETTLAHRFNGQLWKPVNGVWTGFDIDWDDVPVSVWRPDYFNRELAK